MFLPQKSENVRPHSSITLLKMQSHYSQSSRENATPSSGTSPLASYKEVPPSPQGLLYKLCMRSYAFSLSKLVEV